MFWKDYRLVQKIKERKNVVNVFSILVYSK